MDRQTLRDWVIRYNADGLAGLAGRPRPGRHPRLAEAQRREVAKRVEDGPDRKTDGVVRWRCADLADSIAAKFDVHLHERSVGKLLKKLNFSPISVRPVHPQSDACEERAPRSRMTNQRAKPPYKTVSMQNPMYKPCALSDGLSGVCQRKSEPFPQVWITRSKPQGRTH